MALHPQPKYHLVKVFQAQDTIASGTFYVTRDSK
jgi:hypothetical protein